MNSHFTVLYDASVFYPAPLRDLLLQLATVGFFRAKWTEQIHDEWIRSLLKKRHDLKREQLERTRKLINESILDCLVTDYEPFIEGLHLPDPKDRHVLAAAIKAQAQVIVTYNLKDFPNRVLQRFEIEAQHPDVFLRYQIDLVPHRFLKCAKEIRERLKHPVRSPQEYLDTLFSLNLPQTVGFLKHYEDLI